MVTLRGASGSPGIATGAVYVIANAEAVIADHPEPESVFRGAMERVAVELADLRDEATASGRQEAADILGAQALMAEDPMLADAVVARLDAGEGLGVALDAASRDIAATLAALDDEYLAARSADVIEVADRIRLRLAGVERLGLDAMTTAAVVVAEALTAADTARMDPSLVAGFVTDQGGPTGHVAVIARSLGIPAVVGALGATEAALAAQQVALDGSRGEVAFDPDDSTSADFERRRAESAKREMYAARYKGARVSYGSSPVRIAANVGSSDDVAVAVDARADGIGLYRTEFLFLERSEPPSEEEQYEAYRIAAEAFDDPVVIRTLDIGGDKPAPYLNLPPEENPFLGERAVRLYDQFTDLFRGQLRALLRASTAGEIWIMVPMVATLSDWHGVEQLVGEARAELAQLGIPAGDPKIGVMVEVPAAALLARHLASHVDFFSIGTNDLTQYVMAADRTHGRLHRYADAAHPAVLGLCAATARAAAEAGISVAVCGEAASDPVTALLYAAMGMDKLSVTPLAVDRIKATIDESDPGAAAEALRVVLDAATATDVREIVQPLLDGAG